MEEDTFFGNEEEASQAVLVLEGDGQGVVSYHLSLSQRLEHIDGLDGTSQSADSFRNFFSLKRQRHLPQDTSPLVHHLVVGNQFGARLEVGTEDGTSLVLVVSVGQNRLLDAVVCTVQHDVVLSCLVFLRILAIEMFLVRVSWPLVGRISSLHYFDIPEPGEVVFYIRVENIGGKSGNIDSEVGVAISRLSSGVHKIGRAHV